MATTTKSFIRRRVRNRVKPRFDRLEDRTVPAVSNFGGDPQHTGISAVPSQPVQVVHWQTSIDVNAVSDTEHYGAPLITNANTVIYPYRTGSNPPNFHVLGRNGNDGTLIWDTTTDWIPSNHNWYPALQPVLSTFNNRVYYAGEGGTIYYRTNADSATGTIVHLAFYGTLTNYLGNKAAYDSTVFVDTPLTADNQGNIFFGFRTTGTNPSNLTSGIAQFSANDNAISVSARAAANNDTSIDEAARFSTMALSNDSSTLYLGTRNYNDASYGRLVGLNSTTLATQYVSGVLKDPRNNNANNAVLTSDSTSSPMVGPDGRVFYGVFGNPNNGSRGWMLQFSADLATEYTPGGFGWDNTASVIPISMVPGYTGTSTYLIFTKYNNYNLSDGDGSNKIAILDPNDTEVDTHSSANNQLIMKRVLDKLGPTHDSDFPNVATAVREWCINDAAVDPATNSVLVNSEDGHFYRWYLPTNTLTESIQLTTGASEPYTMTVIGVDGTMYGMEDGILFGVGKTPALSITDVTVPHSGTTATFTVSLDFPRTVPITVNYATANGTAIAGTNYTMTSGMLTFAPGEKTKTINVPVNPGSVTAASATFFMNLASPNNATIATSQGQATLIGPPPRVQGITINGGDPQRSRVTSLAVTFSQIVTLPATPANAFSLVHQGDNAPVVLSATVNNAGPGTVVNFTFTGGAVDNISLADGRYTFTVDASQVSNIAGQLDGDNNGTGGDNFALIGTPANGLFRLYGDSDGNGTVNAADFLAFRSAFGGNSFAFDFDNNGSVDSGDFLAFRSRFGSSV